MVSAGARRPRDAGANKGCTPTALSLDAVAHSAGTGLSDDYPPKGLSDNAGTFSTRWNDLDNHNGVHR